MIVSENDVPQIESVPEFQQAVVMIANLSKAFDISTLVYELAIPGERVRISIERTLIEERVH